MKDKPDDFRLAESLSEGILMRVDMKIATLVMVWLVFVGVWSHGIRGQEPAATVIVTPTPSPEQTRPDEEVVPLLSMPQVPMVSRPMPEIVYETKAEEQADIVGEHEGPGFAFTYVPPLSLNDSIRLMRRCIDLLEQNNDQFMELRKETARDALADVIEYVKTVDHAHSLLTHYKWYYIGRNKVSLGEEIDEDTYNVKPLLKGASAISFSATRGDVYVNRMKVIDAHGAETNFKIDKWIDSGLPRREICYLFFQTDIARIIMDYSAKKNESPRLSVYGGVTPMPEYAKEAIYYLAAARKATETGNFPEAIENIKRGWMRLLNYKRARRL